MITELPKPGGDDDGGKTEITPDKGITLYGLVSDKEGNPPRRGRRERRVQRRGER